jgi:hypothetical protein
MITLLLTLIIAIWAVGCLPWVLPLALILVWGWGNDLRVLRLGLGL